MNIFDGGGEDNGEEGGRNSSPVLLLLYKSEAFFSLRDGEEKLFLESLFAAVSRKVKLIETRVGRWKLILSVRSEEEQDRDAREDHRKEAKKKKHQTKRRQKEDQRRRERRRRGASTPNHIVSEERQRGDEPLEDLRGVTSIR